MKDITYTAMYVSCSDLYLEINSEGRVLGRHFTTKDIWSIYHLTGIFFVSVIINLYYYSQHYLSGINV